LSIKAIKLSKSYSNPVNKGLSIEAVKNVSMDINEGSFTEILGPTGSGKTTLISLLTGIIKPTSGEIVFNNIHLSSSRDYKIASFREKYIGYIPQNVLFIKDLNVIENILSPNTFFMDDVKKLKNYALELLERLNLKNKSRFNPFELSGGEKKKVLLIRALIKNPLYVFADEPVSELDEESTNSVLNLLYEHQKQGSTIFLASHKILNLNHEIDIYKMLDGKIIEYIKGES